MIITKQELIDTIHHDIHVLLHLASKIGLEQLDYRPTPGQRSTIELLRFLTFALPVNLRGLLAGEGGDAEWQRIWTEGETESKEMGLEDVKARLAAQPAVVEQMLRDYPEEKFREPLALFGRTVTRGQWLVDLVLVQPPAYRMQLFLYLKASGLSELNSMNLWVGIDGTM